MDSLVCGRAWIAHGSAAAGGQHSRGSVWRASAAAGGRAAAQRGERGEPAAAGGEQPRELGERGGRRASSCGRATSAGNGDEQLWERSERTTIRNKMTKVHKCFCLSSFFS